jgi:hypothetical protein
MVVMNVVHMTDSAAATTATATATRPAANADSQDAPSFAQQLAQAGQQTQVPAATPKETSQSSGHTSDAGTKKQSGAKKDNSTEASSNSSSDSSSATSDSLSAAQLVLPMLVAAPVTIPTPLPTCAADGTSQVASLGTSDPATNVASDAANTLALPVAPPIDAGSVSQASSTSGAQSQSSLPNNVPSSAALGAISAQALAAMLNSAASAAGSVASGAAPADQHLVAQIKTQLDKALQQGSAKLGGVPAQTAAVPQGTSTAVAAPDQKQATMVASSVALPVQAVPVSQPVHAGSIQGVGKTSAAPLQTSTSASQGGVQGQAATSSSTDASSQDAQGDGSSKHDRKDTTTDASTSGAVINTAVVTGNDAAGFRAAVVTNDVGHIAPLAATTSATTSSSSPEVALQNAAASVHGPQHDDGVAAASGSTASSLPSIQSARLVQTASQSEMRVGLQSQEFGNITIHTAAAGQAVSAQISVEHPELARELAARLPEMQAKSESNQTIEVRMSSGQQFSAGTGSGGSSAGQEQQGYRQASASSAAFGSNSADGLFHAASANRISTQPSAATGGRLDIRA